MKKHGKFLIQIFLIIAITVIFYFSYITINLNNTLNISSPPSSFPFVNSTETNDYHIWLIFTKVSNDSPLTVKFKNLVYNLVNVSLDVPIKFHIIIDEQSKIIAQNKLSEVVYKLNQSLTYKFYNVQECASKISDIVSVMSPFFSSKPGTYYSDALFYLSLGLYRFAPISQKRALLLDCDVYFKRSVSVLFAEFNRFKPSAIFGLSPELSPVYHHILHTYKRKHKTTFGEFYHSRAIAPLNVHPRGFQGYNSGIVLINLEKQRSSKEFAQIILKENVSNITTKYKFRGHLGDQDFYTLIGYEYPQLIQTLNCGFNRQLCTWWREHGYKNIFNYYFKCDHETVVLHGNCNTKFDMLYGI
ncbi:hypothetical protein ABEB36_010252 [Hypothenemus hampei]|uniref:Xyloside xylosyltransferase 1 n=1 Tax=Hypothenemus hampei TaxID=57062 RepID=A0ABD1EJ12_HYPHA